jgi:hypothetical protein
MAEIILFVLAFLVGYVWCRREDLTLKEVDKKVTTLGKRVQKINADLKSQEKRMGAASTQASQAQALLTSQTKI